MRHKIRILIETHNGWRVPPNHIGPLDLIQLSRKIGAQVEVRHYPRQREFIAFVRDSVARERLAPLMQQFPQQRIRLERAVLT